MEKTCSQKNNVKTGLKRKNNKKRHKLETNPMPSPPQKKINLCLLKRRTHTGLSEKSTEEAVSSKTQKQTVLWEKVNWTKHRAVHFPRQYKSHLEISMFKIFRETAMNNINDTREHINGIGEWNADLKVYQINSWLNILNMAKSLFNS